MTEISNNQATGERSTEERILIAAEAEFMQKGYAGARTTAIAEAAGVTHAMLHYYYRTKDKLFGRIVSDKISALVRTFLITIDNDKSLAESIRNAVESHFDLVRANPELPRFIVMEVFPNPNLMNMLKEKIVSIAGDALSGLQARIDQGVRDGECRQVSVPSLMMDIISLNVFPFLGVSVLKTLTHLFGGLTYDQILDMRREENVQTILRKILP